MRSCGICCGLDGMDAVDPPVVPGIPASSPHLLAPPGNSSLPPDRLAVPHAPSSQPIDRVIADTVLLPPGGSGPGHMAALRFRSSSGLDDTEPGLHMDITDIGLPPGGSGPGHMAALRFRPSSGLGDTEPVSFIDIPDIRLPSGGSGPGHMAAHRFRPSSGLGDTMQGNSPSQHSKPFPTAEDFEHLILDGMDPEWAKLHLRSIIRSRTVEGLDMVEFDIRMELWNRCLSTGSISDLHVDASAVEDEGPPTPRGTSRPKALINDIAALVQTVAAAAPANVPGLQETAAASEQRVVAAAQAAIASSHMSPETVIQGVFDMWQRLVDKGHAVFPPHGADQASMPVAPEERDNATHASTDLASRRRHALRRTAKERSKLKKRAEKLEERRKNWITIKRVAVPAPPALPDSLRIYSWNLCGIDKDHGWEILREHVKDIIWDILLLQEWWGESVATEDKVVELVDGELGPGTHIAGWCKANTAKRAVGFVLNARIANTFKGFVPHLNVGVVLLKYRRQALHVATAHFPTGEHPVASTYSRLDAAVASAREAKATFLLGCDANAVIGKKDFDIEPGHIGNARMGITNERGEQFVRWLVKHDLSALNTLLIRTDPCKSWTHQNYGSGERRQIDFICAPRKCADCATYCAPIPKMKFSKDHRPVKVEWTPSAPGTVTRENAPRSQGAKYKPIKRKRAVAGWVPAPDHAGVDTSYRDACIECLARLGTADHNAIEQVIVEATWAVGAAAPPAPETHLAISSPSQAELQEDKQAFYRNRLRAIKAAARTRKQALIVEAGQSSRGCKRFREIEEGPVKRQKIVAIKKANGDVTHIQNTIADTFAKHFEHIFRERAYAPDQPPLTPAESSPRATLPPFTVEEVQSAIAQLKNNVKGDQKGITPGMLKQAPAVVIGAITKILNGVLTDEVWPEEWKLSVIIVLLKKDKDPLLASSYRPISIVHILSKLLASLILRRLEQKFDKYLDASTTGFRKGYSTMDNIFTVTQLLDRAERFGTEIWVACLDVVKAFDSVSHDAIWAALADAGVEPQYINLIRSSYTNASAVVSLGNARSRKFPIRGGIKQGDPLSPVLFSVTLEFLLRSRKPSPGFPLGTRELREIRYADDVIGFAHCAQDIATFVEETVRCLAIGGMELDFAEGKSYILTNCVNRAEKLVAAGKSITVGPVSARRKILGVLMGFEHAWKDEVAARLKDAWGAFHRHKALLCCYELSLQARLRLFDQVVTSKALYAAEAWPICHDIDSNLVSAQRAMIRQMAPMNATEREGLDDQAFDTAHNKRIFEAISSFSTPWETRYRHLSFNWLLRVHRMDNDRWANVVLNFRPVARLKDWYWGFENTRLKNNLPKGDYPNRISWDRSILGFARYYSPWLSVTRSSTAPHVKRADGAGTITKELFESKRRLDHLKDLIAENKGLEGMRLAFSRYLLRH